MRLYTAAGVDAGRVAQAAAFNAGAFVIGMTAFGAGGLLWGAPDVAELLRFPSWLPRRLHSNSVSPAGCHRMMRMGCRSSRSCAAWRKFAPCAFTAMTTNPLVLMRPAQRCT